MARRARKTREELFELEDAACRGGGLRDLAGLVDHRAAQLVERPGWQRPAADLVDALDERGAAPRDDLAEEGSVAV